MPREAADRSHVRDHTLCLSPMPLEIRTARPEDAIAACQVTRRSIAELCVADHCHDEAILKPWLSNKTPEVFLSWIGQPDNCLLVAVEGGNILAVGCVTDAGQINLNYVSPDARFCGVSRALLRALEARAAERGNARCTLTSTQTARRFYRANGYVEDGLPVASFGTSSGYPMSRLLAPPAD
jgi:GNAT superfamily N-acetyltransferase